MTVRLPERTRQRVRDAAQKVGYRANRLAQAMKRGRTRMVSVWMPVDRPNLSYLRFLQAISAHARADGYDLMITALDATTALTTEGKTPYVWPVDGMLSLDAGKAIGGFREDPQNDSIPVAIFGLEQFHNTDSVAWDVMGAAREVTERMIARGHRNVVHVTLDWILEGYPQEQRRRGYTEAMEAAGLEPRIVSVGSETSSATHAAVLEWLDRHPKTDAFFGFTDTLAIGAARAVLSRGLRIPEDCMIWGFGDYPEAEDYRVPISSLRTPIVEVVAQAWAWLMERIENQGTDSRLTVLPMELVERESSRG